jgi:hypothetical protein
MLAWANLLPHIVVKSVTYSETIRSYFPKPYRGSFHHRGKYWAQKGLTAPVSL